MIRRTNYFINKGFQLSFVLPFVILMILEAALIAGLLVQVSGNTLTTGYADSILTIERTPNFFFVPLALIILITVLGIGLAGMIIFILLSHKIAGPLYRFEKDLEDVGFGDLTRRITLRKTDKLTDIKETLNTLIATFDERIARIKGMISELKAITDSGESANSARVHGIVKKLKEELDKFKVTPSNE